jgi:hypothetical protein
MKTASPALQALLAGHQFAIADLFTITLRDGTELHYTSCDIDLEYSGDTYLANVLKIQRGPINSSVGVEVDAVELTILACTSDTIQGLPIPAFVRNGGFDGARVLIQRAFMGDQTGPQVTIIVADNYVMRGETSLVTFVWSEVVSGFSLADVTADNGTLSGLTTSDNITFTATFTPTSTEIVDATNVVTVDLEGVQDQSGNWGVGSATSNNYTVDTSYWVQRGSVLTASDAAASDELGEFLALSADGEIMAVSARAWEGASTNQGGVYIFDRSGATWVQRGSVLTAPDAGAEDRFGSCALTNNGDVLVVGAIFWDGGGGTNQGAVYTFDRSGATWVQRGSVLTAPDAGSEDWFGNSVAVSGDGNVLVVSSFQWDGGGGTNQGAVYTFDRSGATWVQRGSALAAPDAGSNDNFGTSVALSNDGTVLIVGSIGWDGGGGTDQGAVYTFDRSGATWVQRGSVLTAPDAGAGDKFGVSVAVSGDAEMLVVGSSGWAGGGGTDQGAVYAFDRSGATWVQRGSVLTAPDAGAGDKFGIGVALSNAGDVLAIGASRWEGAKTDQGGVYIYDSTL